MLTTHSAIYLWWYTRVLGYRIRLTKRVPRSGLTGNIRYSNEWILEPGER